jgi:hypothetical protein
VFSLSRASQRYIIYNFPLPIRYFSIFELFSVESSGQQTGDRSSRKGALSSQRGPLSVEETKGEHSVIRVDMVFKDRTHMSYLMWNKSSASGSRKFSFLSKISPAPFKCPLCLASPDCTQLSSLLQVAPLKAPWSNLGPWIDLIFFLQLILIDPFIQKSWNFHQNSLNSWWSSMYF